MAKERPRVVLFERNANDADTLAVADVLRMETVGGAMMLTAAVVALLWANLGPDSYEGCCTCRWGRSTWSTGPPTACWRSSSSWPGWSSNGS